MTAYADRETAKRLLRQYEISRIACMRFSKMSTPGPPAPFEARVLKRVSGYHSRAKKFGVASTLTYEESMEILEAAEGRCQYCGEEVGVEKLVFDHRVPLSRDGTNTASNIVACCGYCNSQRGYKTGAERERIDAYDRRRYNHQ